MVEKVLDPIGYPFLLLRSSQPAENTEADDHFAIQSSHLSNPASHCTDSLSPDCQYDLFVLSSRRR